jgi:hypothetical protein
MNESTDAFAAVSEAASQLVTGEAIHASFSYDAGGSYSFFISCEKSVIRDLAITAVSLYSIYTLSKLIGRAIDGVIKRWLGAPREDQGIYDIITTIKLN